MLKWHPALTFQRPCFQTLSVDRKWLWFGKGPISFPALYKNISENLDDSEMSPVAHLLFFSAQILVKMSGLTTTETR